MPRQFKCRRVCVMPDNTVFTPQQNCTGSVTLAMEELETLRLCDFEGLDQDEAATSMNVSRATLQRMLYLARRKTADALSSGKAIKIGGGNYELAEQRCGCHHRCRNCRFENQAQTTKNISGGKSTMKIAVTTQGNQVFQHFGQCKAFTVYEVEHGEIKGKTILDAGRDGHAALAGILKGAGVNLLICGGIGDGAKQMLASVGIDLLSGIDGNVDDMVKMYLAGKLADQDGRCTHEHGQDHDCSCEHHCD